MDTLINNKSCVCKKRNIMPIMLVKRVCVYALSAYHQEVGWPRMEHHGAVIQNLVFWTTENGSPIQMTLL